MDVPTETRIFWGVTNSDLSTVLLHQKLRTNSKHHGSKKLKKRHVRTTRVAKRELQAGDIMVNQTHLAGYETVGPDPILIIKLKKCTLPKNIKQDRKIYLNFNRCF